LNHWQKYTVHGIYIVVCVMLLVLVGNSTNTLDITQHDASVAHMYAPEQRDTAPYIFRWGAQDATFILPHPSNGWQLMTFTATTPVPDSRVTWRTQGVDIGTYAIANGVFRRYMVLTRVPVNNAKTIIVAHSNRLSQYGRELAIGVSAISLHALSPLVWPVPIYVLMMIYTVVVVSVWRMTLPMTIGCYGLSVVYVWWTVYGNSGVAESWMYGYMVVVAMVVVLASWRLPVVAPPLANMATTYRADIDGLRAIAVGAVVLYHFFPANVPNGYVGVDVFFVISGYLISQILFRNFATNTFSLRDFYARRVRRIFPALTAMVIVVLSIGAVVLFPDEYQQLGRHVGAGTGFVLNLLLYSEIGYFDTQAVTKPLLHLWSLGVEEQFYLVWPLLLYLFRQRIAAFKPLIVTISALSFFCYIILNASNPSATFYWPITRFWELGGGALLAYHTLTVVPSAARPALADNVRAWLGLGVLVSSIVGVDTVLLPGAYALVLPVVGAGILIAAGSATWVNRQILGNRLAVGTGLVSFPFYLWHWPVLSLSEIVSNHQLTPPMRWVLIGVSLILAIMTYFMIEKPLRVGRYRMISVRQIATTTIGLGICAGMLIGTGVVPPYSIFSTYNTDIHNIDMAKTMTSFDSPCRDIVSLLHDSGECLSNLSQNATGTEYYFIGDSHAGAMGTMNPPRQNLTVYTVPQCRPFIGADFFYAIPNNDGTVSCKERNPLPLFIKSLTMHATKNHRVILLFARYSWLNANTLVNGPQRFDRTNVQITDANQHTVLLDVDAAFRQGLTNVLMQLTQLPNTTVVFVHQVPETGVSVLPKNCNRLQMFYSTQAANCSNSRQPIDGAFAHYKAVAGPVLALFPTVQQYDPMDALCDVAVCITIQDNHRIYTDNNHVSSYGATLVTTQIWARYP